MAHYYYFYLTYMNAIYYINMGELRFDDEVDTSDISS